MFCVENDLIPWLNQTLDEWGWSQRELARRAGVSATTISEVLAGNRKPTWNFCADIARPLGVDPDDVFVLAGLKRAPPAAVAGEEEALGILRRLPGSVRDVVMAMLRGLARESRGVAGVGEGLAPYRWDEEPWVRELVEEFRKVPDEWKEEALHQVSFVRQMAARPDVRMIGEEASPKGADVEGERDEVVG